MVQLLEQQQQQQKRLKGRLEGLMKEIIELQCCLNRDMKVIIENRDQKQSKK